MRKFLLVSNWFLINLEREQVINELRAGGMDFETAFSIALMAAVGYMMYVNRVQGFQPVHHYPPRIGEWDLMLVGMEIALGQKA
jgi:hypothetical protein